jgi:2-keto-4-pentenoate hydratase/2-oxohepta-3-ene-1,7-dioic acid hydratase in catechol pathway
VRYLRLLVGGVARHGRVSEDTIILLDGDPLAGAAHDTESQLPLDGAKLLPPCTPTKILGIGLNYRAHAAEMGKPLPDEPLMFMKPPSALLPPGAPIVRPRGYARVDYEGELCVVIGRRTRDVTDEEALSYVFGYTVLNDVTVRDLQKKDVQYTRAKGFDSFCPVGPCIQTDLDPRNARLRTRHNGVVKQDSSTEDLIFSVAQVVAFASRTATPWRSRSKGSASWRTR